MADEIGVIGLGTMGSGIAHSSLQAGYRVILVGRDRESADEGLRRLGDSLGKAVKKGVLTEAQKSEFLGRAVASGSMESIASCSIVIEAVPEELELKGKVLKGMENFSAKGAVLATNTSSIPIGRLSEFLGDPSRFIGLHFFNPVPAMKPVEVVVGKKTSAATVEKSAEFIKRLQKVPIMVNDSPGFISNRILMPFINEAAKALQEGVADKEAIDSIAKLGFNHPMGPLELADFIGLDVCVDIMYAIYKERPEERFKPAAILERLVADRKTGKKSGSGFYSYNK
jgi:3-hydroxybutyryl-CoA dehydrogenase